MRSNPLEQQTPHTHSTNPGSPVNQQATRVIFMQAFSAMTKILFLFCNVTNLSAIILEQSGFGHSSTPICRLIGANALLQLAHDYKFAH